MLTFIGIFVVIGVIFAVLGAESFWQVLASLLIGGPLAALFASWPIALGQALRAPSPTSPSTYETSRKESQPSV